MRPGQTTPFKARKVGWYLRAKLQLKPYKTRIKGYVLSYKENRKRLDMGKNALVSGADIRGIEQVSDVNITN